MAGFDERSLFESMLLNCGECQALLPPDDFLSRRFVEGEDVGGKSEAAGLALNFCSGFDGVAGERPRSKSCPPPVRLDKGATDSGLTDGGFVEMLDLLPLSSDSVENGDTFSDGLTSGLMPNIADTISGFMPNIAAAISGFMPNIAAAASGLIPRAEAAAAIEAADEPKIFEEAESELLEDVGGGSKEVGAFTLKSNMLGLVRGSC